MIVFWRALKKMKHLQLRFIIIISLQVLWLLQKQQQQNSMRGNHNSKGIFHFTVYTMEQKFLWRSFYTVNYWAAWWARSDAFKIHCSSFPIMQQVSSDEKLINERNSYWRYIFPIKYLMKMQFKLHSSHPNRGWQLRGDSNTCTWSKIAESSKDKCMAVYDIVSEHLLHVHVFPIWNPGTFFNDVDNTLMTFL